MNGSGMSSQYESDLGEWAGDYQNLERDNPPMWRPRPLAFRPYVASSAAMSRDSASVGEGVHHRPLRVIVNKPHVIRLTKDITETYQICNPSFTYSDILNPTVYLTKPSTGVLNDGYDNANSDLIMAVSFLLVNSDANRRYIVLEMLGQGTFGQVVKCWSPETNNYVAVKVIKNQPAYYHQALVEISILAMLNRNYDPEDKHHIVRIIDHFVFQKHLCITFELLGVNLFELLKMNHYRGVSLKLLRLFAKQILDALLVLREASVIHCDLKPENILLTESVQSGEIKLIDFGSACMENRTVYSYIQSRFYRSPEVLLGHPYTTAIDMWSFGCIVAELFLGLPLFPGASEYDLIKRMIQILRDQPPDHILRTAKNTSKYFKLVGNSSQLGEKHSLDGHKSSYHFLTEAEYEAREMKKPASGKRYFNYDTLEEIIINYPYKRPMTEEELSKENETRLAFIDFVRGLVQFDPVKRWTPRQAVQHPFVTEEAFTCPFVPPLETPRTPVRQIVRVDHNPGAGHWFAAGLSPQVSNMNRAVHYTSPQYQQAAFPYGSSYGSIGSHGSYGDGFGLGSSYGSYGDMSNKFIGYCPLTPSGISMQNQGASAGSVLGASPDTRWRMPQVPHGHTLGISPSNSMLRPMSLGASPSQFTPPSSQMQVSTGSPIGSPGRYGPTSPARAGGHVSGLGKAAAVGQYKRRGFGMPGALHLSCQDNLSQHFQGAQKNFPSNCDSALNSGEGTSRIGYVGSPRGNQPNMHQQTWRQRCGSGMPSVSNSSVQHTVPGSNASSQHTVPISNASSSFAPHAMPGCNASTSTAQHIVSGSSLLPESDGTESNSPLPDPGDWDPNYSDDLLLQEDGSEIISPRYAGSGAMHFNQGTSSSSTLCPGAGRSGNNYAMSQAASSSNSNAHRSNGFVQGHSNLDGSSTSLHAMQPGYARSLSKPLHHGLHSSQQSTLSRLGQQPSQHSQLHYQHSHSMLHPDILSLPNTVGQMHAQQYPNEKSFVGGKGPLPFLCSPSKDSQPDCVHFPQRGTGPTTAMASGVVQHQSQASQWPAGMGHMHGQSSFTHELSWGQRAGHSLTTFSPPSYGKRDYRRAG